MNNIQKTKEKEIYYTSSQKIRDVREDNDLTQLQISKLLNTTRQQYSKYENGIRPIPARHLITLCKYYNLSADYLLGLTDEPKPLKK